MYALAFILSSVVLFFSYTHTQNYLRHHNIAFSRLTENRQFYVVKNITKGIYLAFLVVFGFFFVILPIINNEYNNATIRIFASLYVSNDFIGLYGVGNLPTSTRLHHSASVIFLLAAWTIDFQTSVVGQMLLLYTYFSAIAFPVNLYLGLRLCYDVPWLRTVAKYVYSISCAVNWYIQYAWFTMDRSVIVYLTLLSVIVFDDVVLLRWLYKWNNV